MRASKNTVHPRREAGANCSQLTPAKVEELFRVPFCAAPAYSEAKFQDKVMSINYKDD